MASYMLTCAQVSGPTMEPTSFLSVRVPPTTRNRIKAAAAARGQSVQGLVGDLIERFLATEEPHPPALPEILSRLRTHSAELKARGIDHLWVFGSIARGDARLDSDLDLIAEIRPAVKMSMTGFASLRADLTDMVRHPVDLAEWTLLRPPVRARAHAEAVQVF